MFRLLFILLRYYVFWIIFSIFMRVGFIAYNHDQASSYSLSEIAMTFLYGLKLDLCMSSYFILIPVILLSISFLMPVIAIKRILSFYTFILILFSSLVAITDFELYRNWGFRMDKTPLLYLKTPGEALASTETWLTITLFVAMSVVSFIFYTGYRKFVASFFDKTKPGIKSLLLIFIIPVLIIPIRGGFGVSVLNASAVYFHTAPFINHSALNVVWNVGYSLTTNETEKSYPYFDNDKAIQIFQDLQSEAGISKKVLNTNRPNIIILILESFSSRIVEPLGGIPGICPNLNRLCSEGILFEYFYANGDRSDKGLVSILSGYPAQPTNSIIKFPEKTMHLPFLSKELGRSGYSSSLYYGGDLKFANMKSYFVNGKFDEIITVDDFPDEFNTGKWGVHDQYVFDRLLTDLDKTGEPFFKVLFSLSSHEPFEIPIKAKFPGSDEDNMFLSSAFYTDSCLGNFITQAKTKDWWDNSIIVILADHGSYLPGNVKYYEEEKFKIPMLWLGGALNITDTIISTYGSQVDVPKTLLSQMQLNNSAFEFGKDLLAPGGDKFSFFVFNDGFGFADSSFIYIHDNISDTAIFSQGDLNIKNKNKGKAYLQILAEDYMRK